MIKHHKIVLIGNSSLSMIKFRAHLIKFLNEKECNEVYVICPRDEFVDDLVSLNVRWIEWDLIRDSRNPFQDLMAIKKLYWIIKRLKPAFCITFTIKPNIYGSLICKILNVPSLAVTTGLGYVFLNKGVVSFLSKVLYRICFKWPRKVLFLNHSDLDLFVCHKLVNKRNTALISGEGVDSLFFEFNDNTENKKILFLGRVLWDKGFKEFVEVAKLTKRDFPDYEFVVVGKVGFGNPSDVPKEYIDKHVSEGTIVYKDFTKDVRDLLRSSKFLVLPSYSEGIPMTVLEAGCMGVPSIVSDAPGCKNVVLAGITGFHCKVESVEDLYDKMKEALRLKDSEYREMAMNAREFIIKNFEFSKVISEYENIFIENNFPYSYER